MSNQFEQIPSTDSKAKSPASPEKETEIKIWGETTDPKEHDPEKFRYLVHAFKPFARASQPIVAISAELSGAFQDYKLQDDKLQGDQSINLFEQPEKLGERVSLCMSLIDQNHTGTWGKGGIIVDAPEENIVITSPTDAGSHSSSKEFLEIQARYQLPRSGEQLLQSTPRGTYNEVVAFAKTKRGECKLRGFFVKVDKRGQPIDPVIAERMRQHARRLSLPLVEIQVQGPYEQEMFEIEENSMWAYYKENRYDLGSDNPEFAFYAYNDTDDTFFPSPEEIEEVIAHFTQRGDINEAQAQQIRERYKIADAERKSPKVEYDIKTSEISHVKINDGYGKDAIEYWLSPSGYCWRVNMEEYKKALKKAFLNPKRIITDPYEYLIYQTPISGTQVLSILESRKGMMEPEEYERLVGFFQDVRDKIDQVYNQQSSFRRESRFWFFKIFAFF